MTRHARTGKTLRPNLSCRTNARNAALGSDGKATSSITVEATRRRWKELKEVVDELGIESTWTMESEASEYRETVALEASMRSTVDVRKKWPADQAALKFEAGDFEDAEQEFEGAEG